jgi:hypothetical protein
VRSITSITSMLRACLAIALPLVAEAWAASFHQLPAAVQSGRSHRGGCLSRRARLTCLASEPVLNEEQRQSFWRHGFVLVSDILTQQEAEECRSRYEPMFAGSFDTGIYPDEWHWRQGISLPGAVREICNGWKSDTCIQRTVLDERFGRIACELMQWQSASVE